MPEKIKGPLDREDDFHGGPVNPLYVAPEISSELRRLRGALKFYADPSNYDGDGAADEEWCGRTACIALGIVNENDPLYPLPKAPEISAAVEKIDA